jgi:AcrR family transcriptional regulator
MRGERNDLHAEVRERLEAVIVDWGTADYVTVRAVAALSDDAPERLARFTAMGREFVVDVRKRAREAGAAALLADPPSVAERVLEAATEQLVHPGRRGMTLRTVSRASGLPLRTAYNTYATTSELIAMCRRRAQTIWRARFELRILSASDDPVTRILAIVDVVEEWILSDRFRHDQALRARPSFSPHLRDDDLREHLAEVDRFATSLAVAAGLRAPNEFGAFVATLVDGATGWFDRRDAARAAIAAIVEGFIAATGSG